MRYADAGVVLGLSLIVGCAAQQAPAATTPRLDEAAARTALAPRIALIGEAFARRDTAAVTGLFTDDAVWILSDATTFKGKDEIQKGMTGLFAAVDSVSAATENVDKVIVVSDSEVVSFSTGKYTVYLKGKKGEAHLNPYADDWKKGADGTWRIAYEVNAEGTVAAPTPAPVAKKS